MEPFVPIPGKPPRKVVVDRQRKLFASLGIEDLLEGSVSFAYLTVRASTTRMQTDTKQSGYL